MLNMILFLISRINRLGVLSVRVVQRLVSGRAAPSHAVGHVREDEGGALREERLRLHRLQDGRARVHGPG